MEPVGASPRKIIAPATVPIRSQHVRLLVACDVWKSGLVWGYPALGAPFLVGTGHPVRASHPDGSKRGATEGVEDERDGG